MEIDLCENAGDLLEYRLTGLLGYRLTGLLGYRLIDGLGFKFGEGGVLNSGFGALGLTAGFPPRRGWFFRPDSVDKT